MGEAEAVGVPIAGEHGGRSGDGAALARPVSPEIEIT
jgi:hypothetical protein